MGNNASGDPAGMEEVERRYSYILTWQLLSEGLDYEVLKRDNLQKESRNICPEAQIFIRLFKLTKRRESQAFLISKILCKK